MRITNQMLFDAARLQIATARERLVNAQQQVNTGQRVIRPGDDPGAAGAIVAHSMAVQRFDTINQSISRAEGESELADSSLRSVGELLARARELAVQLGNDSYSASERAGGAQEIRTISSQIVKLMNVEEGGRYLFGGNTDRTPPFDPAGNYQGDTAVRQVEVAPGLLQNASLRADSALKGVGGGVDIFAVLNTVANAMASNDGATVRTSLDSLATSTDQLAAALTASGGIMEGFRSASSIGYAAKESATKLLSAVSEVDIFEAMSNLTQAQQGLEATLAVSAKSFSITLLDFLPR